MRIFKEFWVLGNSFFCPSCEKLCNGKDHTKEIDDKIERSCECGYKKTGKNDLLGDFDMQSLLNMEIVKNNLGQT